MKIILVVLLFIVTFFAFTYITDVVVVDKDYDIDLCLQSYVDAHRSPAATWFFIRITIFGSHLFLIPAYLILIAIFLNKRRKHAAINIFAVGLSSTAILFLIKEIFKRHRPYNPLVHGVNGFSFPSGHSFSGFTFYGVIIYLIWRSGIQKWKKIVISSVLVVFASTIAYSRVYLRVHYPSDVIAGFCLSIIWLILSFVVLTRTRFFK